jgi:multiple sugar transport system permease protein
MSAVVPTHPEVKLHRRLDPRVLTALGIVLTLLMLFPFYMIINYSLMKQTDILNYPPPFIPPKIDFTGYAAAFSTMGVYIRNSLIYGFGTVLISMAIAAPAAYALSRFQSKLTLALLMTLLLVQMAPGIVVANSLYALFTKLHMLNSYFAVILADCTAAVPFAIIVMRAFMLSIPKEMSEAAIVDGAGPFTVFWEIIMPISRTAIITAALFSFLSGWGDFMMALILMNDQKRTPITVGIYYFIGNYSVQWPAVMASAMIAAAPAVILLASAQRYIAAGITAGAVKE